MKTYTTLHAGLARELENIVEDILTRNETTPITLSDLDTIWSDGHTENGAYDDPLSDMCKAHGWQHRYEDYGMTVRIARA